MSERHQKSILPSGITLVTEAMPDRGSISFGAWVKCGSRDEPVPQLGISHFIEHMMFKGTERRDARSIASSLESLGGNLDAFTSREQVCYYARAMAEHLPEVVDVVADIVCRSRFAQPDVEMEKSVVREEIYSCDDNPEDKVGELLNEQVWGGHPLGLPILGTVETVSAFRSDDLRTYFSSRYRGDQLLVAAAGNLEHDRVAELVEKAFTPPRGDVLPLSDAPPPFVPSVRHYVRKDLQQLQVALGTRGVPYGHPDRYALHVLNALLGGGMSSRLFQSVREEKGLAYSIFSGIESHRDAGMITIQMGVAPDRGREALACVRAELETLRAEGPTVEEVDSARSQIRGGMVIGQESVSNRMYHLAYDELYRGRHCPLEEEVARVMAVTHEDVRRAAARYLDPATFALAVLGPAEHPPITEADWSVTT